MQVKKSNVSDTEVTLTVVTKPEELTAIKNHVLTHFQTKVKLAGFREGKAPLSLVEKNVDPAALQSEFLEEAINQLYPQVIRSENLRPVAQPEINLTKFVPFTTLEFDAKVTVIGDIKLPDYKKMKSTPSKVTVAAKDVDDVVKSLQQRAAEKKDVDRAAKKGDQPWIDFSGTDSKGQPIKGADGKDYPLLLGSNTFIPGFEDNVVGLKAGDEKTFTLTFPKDYGVKALASKKVTFKVSVTKVQELVEPAADDDFAAKVGPFKSLQELKADIKKQLQTEREQQVNLEFESEIVRKITEKTKLNVPKVLVDDQIERMVQDERQNIVYRGQTWEEFLSASGLTEEQYREQKRPIAEERVKASLVLAEIADAEKLDVTPQELEVRISALKDRYKDAAMQAELDKPENRRDIAMRMLTEKTVAKLVGYATSK